METLESWELFKDLRSVMFIQMLELDVGNVLEEVFIDGAMECGASSEESGSRRRRGFNNFGDFQAFEVELCDVITMSLGHVEGSVKEFGFDWWMRRWGGVGGVCWVHGKGNIFHGIRE